MEIGVVSVEIHNFLLPITYLVHSAIGAVRAFSAG